jgi:hypothetical protein
MPKNDISRKQKGYTKRYRLSLVKQAGFGLVESLLAVAILGSTIFMLMGGLSTGAISVGILQEDIVAENLGRTQLEYTKSLPYNTAPFSYQSIAEVPEGYTITTEATSVSDRNENIQRLIITIYREYGAVYVLEGFKVNR